MKSIEVPQAADAQALGGLAQAALQAENDARAKTLAYTRRVLDLIAKENITAQDADWITRETVENFRDHVNPGFLEYRKATSVEHAAAAVEWSDAGLNAYRDVNGKEYIDCLGGFGIYNVGHRHPKVVKAVTDQLKRQALHSQDLLDPLRAMLAKALAMLTPGDLEYSFFCNSGTEAIEAALKLARAYDHTKQTVVAATKGFHGKSMGALSVSAKGEFRTPFGPMLPNIEHVPFNDLPALRWRMQTLRTVGEDVGAVILEPIQGEGGVNIPSDDYLPGVRALCDEYGALLVLDEVQTGMGRTGKMFACEHWGVAPDLLCLAKAFGGGVMPAGAVVGTKAVFSRIFGNPFLHTTTFGGNPLACAAALATITVLIEEELPQRAASMGERMLRGLREAAAGYEDIIVDMRGKGMLIAMEFPNDELGFALSKAMLERGVLVSGTLVNARVIRVEPPLTLAEEQADYVCQALRESLAHLKTAR
ncbi:MAG: putrescine aminotransferase [Candidatus Eremiobacter antarcticus]|nr:putrescine aminotransferase [Candidatus Eremiobacteraeota bacterium]MBC5807089.1 putrescine aminotransferase [Candidatus Eremiobacteraeota bacterium]PZR62394.1 MAG: putrescine aminotransferase [Candidatus Eremiobacter sp. RRmetagenome_bin22]